MEILIAAIGSFLIITGVIYFLFSGLINSVMGWVIFILCGLIIVLIAWCFAINEVNKLRTKEVQRK
jgi:uncharacterized membrane protein HdeD (DUF308 family)